MREEGKIKVFAVQERVEQIKQQKEYISMYIEEKASNDIDGHKLFEISNKYSKVVGLGMDETRLKITIATKGLTPDKWLTIIIDLLNALAEAKKEEISSS